MIQVVQMRVLPDHVHDLPHIRTAAAEKLGIPAGEIDAVQVTRRSIDARGRNPMFELRVAVYMGEPVRDLFRPVEYHPAASGRTVIVVGSGPAGLFAALRLIEHGIRPVVLERGKPVRDRRFDLKTLQVDGQVHPDSNYCFGEGGAGTFSDGKLYTRSTKRGDIQKILSVLVQHGADKDILVNAHPHIGSNRLPGIITAIRDTILESGGQIHFNCRVEDLILRDNQICGVRTGQEEFTGQAVILATGHSARDMYHLLDRHGIALEAKPFAMGVRVEHPQEQINAIQYGAYQNSRDLPAAMYSLSCQVDKTGVYSFCMCPGGMLIPAATAPGEVVLNGMSNSLRNLPRANAGIVVSIDSRMLDPDDAGPFAGLKFQQQVEQKAFEAGGRTQAAPAQRLTDFLKGRVSGTLPDCSYRPGAVSRDVAGVLGPLISGPLKAAFPVFERQMKGYVSREAIVVAVESRTSSPVRIPRDRTTWMHPHCGGLFPSGEGAGYAGGIVSSAMDGEACADAVRAYVAGIGSKST